MARVARTGQADDGWLRDPWQEKLFALPGGGSYIWLELPADVDGDMLVRRAAEGGVSVLAGSRCFVPGTLGDPSSTPPPRDHVRLAFGEASPGEIDEGVLRLAAALAKRDNPGR